MRTIVLVLCAGLLAVAGCGGDDDETPVEPGTQAAATATAQPPSAATAEPTEDDTARGTEIVVGESEFGDMLFDAERQAIYIFEKDPEGETVCYDECAEAWPPVYTDGEPVAGKGVKASLLGTIERRDGRTQVTYAGKPLYFYAHEDPGQVLCHNVNLNGGLWWVVGPDGKRRA